MEQPEPQRWIQQAPNLVDIGGDCGTLVVDEGGVIRECSAGARTLFRASESALVGRHLSTFIPHFAHQPLLRAGTLDPQLDYLCHCGAPFRARRASGEAFACELYFHACGEVPGVRLRVIVHELGPLDVALVSNPWCLE